MSIEVRMPQLGLTMTEGVIVDWLKKEGDFVKKGEPLCEVTTDKLSSKIESESEGVLIRIIAQPGDEIPVKGLLAYIGKPGEKIEDIPGGYAPVMISSIVSKSKPVQFTVDPFRVEGLQKRVKISPLARKTAERMGVPVGDLFGSGPGGRIIQADILAVTEKLEYKTAKADSSGSGLVHHEKMSTMRRSIARNMLRSWTTAPAVTFHRQADAKKILQIKTNFTEGDNKISVNDILVKIFAVALIKHPILNANVEGEEIVYHDYVNLGIAMALEKGLVVPIIKNAHQLNVKQISQEIRSLRKDARNSTLSEGQMMGGTSTLTNLGMYGVEYFTPILNPPQACILGVGTIIKGITRKGTIGQKIFLSLTTDHRIVDGVDAVKFLDNLCTLIENPLLLLWN